MNLLSDVQLLDDSTVSLDIDLLEVAEKISSVTNHLKKAATAVEVLVVVLEVCVEVVDTVCENSDLNLRRACVAFMDSVVRDDLLLNVFLKHGFHLINIIFRQTEQTAGEYARYVPLSESYVCDAALLRKCYYTIMMKNFKIILYFLQFVYKYVSLV